MTGEAGSGTAGHCTKREVFVDCAQSMVGVPGALGNELAATVRAGEG